MKSWIIIGALLTILSGAAYFYYSTTQSRIENLIIENASYQKDLETAVRANEQNVQTINDLRLETQRLLEDYNLISSQFQAIRIQNNLLREKLGRHELDALAAARPGLVERTINNASKKTLRCFELLSGAPLTNEELNSTSGNQFNSECPWLWEELVIE